MRSPDTNQSKSGRSTGAQLLGLAVFLLLTFCVATIASQFMPGAWYQALSKPSWTPPGWVFGPVWTFLYASMAVAAWLVWKKKGWHGARAPLVAYFIQLLLNGLWSWFFFGQYWIGVALIDILALLAAIGVTLILFWRVKRVAGILFIPYLLWVAFASVLNFQIWRMN
jgi:benzodiazapine receptor